MYITKEEHIAKIAEHNGIDWCGGGSKGSRILPFKGRNAACLCYRLMIIINSINALSRKIIF
jgi:hypothetical protein